MTRVNTVMHLLMCQNTVVYVANSVDPEKIIHFAALFAQACLFKYLGYIIQYLPLNMSIAPDKGFCFFFIWN